MKKYLPTNRSKASCLLLIVLVIGFYLGDNLSLFSFIDSNIYNDVFKPLYWCLIIFITWRLPKIRPESKIRHRNNIYFWAFFFAVIHILIWFAFGLFEGFGENPFNTSLAGIIRNIIILGPALIGKEFVRGQLVSHSTRKENYFMFILITMLLTITNFSFTRFSGLTSIEKTVQFLAQFFLPDFSRSLMATYFSYIGGPTASIFYISIFNIVEFVSPILPNLKWITTALVGIMCPVFSLIWMQNIYMKESKLIKKSKKENESPLGWAATCIASIGIVWFAAGVFPIYPSVIATGSMEPMIKAGDMILVEKVQDMTDIEKIKVGDVIQFDRENILICHRVVEILKKEDGLYYRTKGDNNSAPDFELVKPEQVKGQVTQVIPKIGWPTLLLKSQNDISLDEIEF